MKTYLARLLVFNVERLFNPKVLFQIQKLALKSATGFVHKKRWGFKKLIYLFYESKINL